MLKIKKKNYKRLKNDRIEFYFIFIEKTILEPGRPVSLSSIPVTDTRNDFSHI